VIILSSHVLAAKEHEAVSAEARDVPLVEVYLLLAVDAGPSEGTLTVEVVVLGHADTVDAAGGRVAGWRAARVRTRRHVESGDGGAN
jgi:hypothetical protein